MNIRILLTCIILGFVSSTALFSQNYPIQTTIQITPPYTSYLPDYVDAGNSKLQVALQITDINVASAQVRLKLSLEGPGGLIQTNPTFHPTPIAISFGTPVILSGSDLAPYLNVENLLFPSDEFKQNYIQTKTLPEGLWKLCVEVKDAFNPNAELLSTNNCNLMFIALSQAPVLNLPICSSELPTAASIAFSWTDFALGTQTFGNEPIYDFFLYAVPTNAYTNPTQAINSNPIFTTTTNQTSFVLNTNEILLTSNQHYVWRVKARLPNGAASYINGGFSAPCDFTYSNPSQAIVADLQIALSVQATGSVSGKGMWEVTSLSNSNSNQFEGFIISYRKKGNANYGWHEALVETNSYSIQQLEDSTEYEVKVRGYVGADLSPWTAAKSFLTDPYPQYACGDNNIPTLPNEFTPLKNYDAYPGIHVNQGQFMMDVTSIDPLPTGEGHFKGTGKIRIDFLMTSVRVSFDDLLIDADYNARSGQVQVITKGAEQWLADQYMLNNEAIHVDGTIETGGFLNGDTVYVVVGTDTMIYHLNPPLPTILHDDNYTEYQFWPDTMIVKAYGIVLSEDHLDVSSEQHLYFVDSDTQLYPTDKNEGHPQFIDNYEAILGANNYKYFVSNKSASNYEGDVAVAHVHVADLNLFIEDQVKFILESNNQELAYTVEDTTYTLTLPVMGSNYAVYAEYNGLRIGKLNVKVFEKADKNITIVPLVPFNYTDASIQSALESYLKGAQVNLNIHVDSLFSTTEFNASTAFENPNTNLLAKYTTQMRVLRDAYLETHTLPSDHYLIFVIPSFQNTEIDGYMVRGRGLGFVASNNNFNAFAHTLAHELGHGIGGLKHAWGDNLALKNKTKNLMDYDNGSKLIAKQWKAVHDSPNVINFLDGEEEGSLLTENYFDWKIYLADTNEKTISRTQITSSDIFYCSNELYFSFTNNQLNNIKNVVLRKGYIIGITDNNNVRFEVAIQKYNFSVIDNVIPERLILFYNPNISERYFTKTVGDTIYNLSKRDASDINIAGYKICSEVSKYLYNIVNDELVFKTPRCVDNEDSDCNWTSAFLFDNVGSCAFRINRSSNSCLQNISIGDKVVLLNVLIDAIINLNENSIQTYYNEIDFEDLGQEVPSEFISGVFNDGGAYDLGVALVKLCSNSIHQNEFSSSFKNLLKANNYNLLQTLLLNWSFYDVSFPLSNICSQIESIDIESTRKETFEFLGSQFTVSSLYKPYILSTIGSNRTVECQELSSSYSAHLSMTYENGVIHSNGGVTENYHYLISKNELSSNGVLLLGDLIPTIPDFIGSTYEELNNFNSRRTFFINGVTYSGIELPNEHYLIDIPELYSFSGIDIDPLEIMSFVFDEQHNSLGIEKGKVYIMPAVWGFCMYKAINDEKEAREDRIFINQVTIGVGTILAPFTGGASLALALSSVGAAAFDIVNENRIENQDLAEYQDEETFRIAWNSIYTSIQIADGVYGAVHIVKSVQKVAQACREAKFLKKSKEIINQTLVNKIIEANVSNAGKLIDDALATALKTHPNFSKLGLSITELNDFKSLLNTKMPNSASDIFDGLKSHLDAGTEFRNMQQCISGLKNNWGNFSDGSKWVFNYTSSSQGLSKFGGKTIRFELPIETELGLRRVDIADITNANNPILYEFKSVQTPFNSTYATQFAKDLSEASGLDKIRWMFDGAKNPVLNKTQILNLIENTNIPQSTINKYFNDGLIHSKSELIDLIDSEFNNIFKVISL
jgi:hypothetical protein